MLDSTKLNGEEKAATKNWKSWDFKNFDSLIEGASYYEAWLRSIYPMIWDEVLDSRVPLPEPASLHHDKIDQRKARSQFFDIKLPLKRNRRRYCQKIIF